MIVNVEFLDEDPMENVITSLHYQIDKTYFFGYQAAIDQHRQNLRSFLKSVCGVREVEFCEVDPTDLNGILDAIRTRVLQEREAGNQVFFDLTGGESLLLTAFGILSKELTASMHLYDIPNGRIHEYGYEGSRLLSECAKELPIRLNLAEFIGLYGGSINELLQKQFKKSWDPEDVRDVNVTWALYERYRSRWMHYSALFRKFAPDEALCVCIDTEALDRELKKSPKAGTKAEFFKFLDACAEAGLLQQVSYTNKSCRYRYQSMNVKNYFWDGGSILEAHIFLKESEEHTPDDCRIGVHIDWDGKIHRLPGEDVLNEIDVMSIKDNLPTLISCKMGNVDQMALYELETIANRFGGTYAKKVLVVAREVTGILLQRAEEMKIEVRKID